MLRPIFYGIFIIFCYYLPSYYYGYMSNVYISINYTVFLYFYIFLNSLTICNAIQTDLANQVL
ncbi:uncharacterized protein RJT20DRAFT_41049 [Scheffersomyces xylosifermentans]|uniref:uncharacterized protein n=1 Tax=Scheffersomyces xylosifermentans TaxID=1304137 RepID=UPI00315D0BA0